MLDGLLGRGFSVKCKSLVKDVRARLEVVRRRAEAKQRFLKEDLTKLLSNGLDINAYGRTEEFLAGMNLLSCYDFIAQACEYILKQLSRMQKHRECPDECRQAVASLMFAASRFSDLPELRDLRDLFEQKYGNCLDIFVNQKFVEKLSPSPFAAEKKLKVLQDIASEYSIKWDFMGFEKRMAASSVTAQAHLQKQHIIEHKFPTPGGYKDRIHRNVDSPHKPASSSHGARDAVLFPEKLSSSAVQKPKDQHDVYKPERPSNSSSHGKRKSPEEAKTENNSSSIHTTGRGFQAPPYIKSDRDTHRPSKPDGPHNKGDSIEKTSQNGDDEDHETQFLGRKIVDNHHHVKIPLPKPRSIRRKPHKSSAERTEEGSDPTDNKSNSRRRDKSHSRKGLKLLFEEEHRVEDKEEMMIDKLLIHYSKKPSTYDARKLKMKDGKCLEATIVPPHPSRSVSLPAKQCEDGGSCEGRKVFARAHSFEPGGAQAAPHVHPKLPDYDDLAARFAALKGR